MSLQRICNSPGSYEFWGGFEIFIFILSNGNLTWEYSPWSFHKKGEKMVHFKAYRVSQILTVEWWAFYCCPASDFKTFSVQMEGPAWIVKDLREVLYKCTASKSWIMYVLWETKCKNEERHKPEKGTLKGWGEETDREKCTNPFFLLGNNKQTIKQ